MSNEKKLLYFRLFGGRKNFNFKVIEAEPAGLGQGHLFGKTTHLEWANLSMYTNQLLWHQCNHCFAVIQGGA